MAEELQVFEGADGWRVRFVGANGEIVFTTEAYATKSNAKRSAADIARRFRDGVRVTWTADDE